jgi:hypothetical protein
LNYLQEEENKKMTISATVSLGSATATGSISVPLSISIRNGSGESVFVQGIRLLNSDGVLTLGDFQQFYPVTYQIVSGGTAVTSSIPKWGTADQSTETIVGDPLVYWIGNISGSSLVTASFTGLHIPSGSQTIPAGATGSFQSAVIVTTPPLLPQPVLSTDVGALLFVSGAVSGSRTFSATTASLDYTSKPVDRIACSLVGANALTSFSTWGRPIAFANFDAYVETNIVYTDGTQTPVSAVASDFTSSDPSVVSVVQNGAFGSQTGSLGNAQLTAGGGALTFIFPSNFSPQPSYATIENRLSDGLTGSVKVGLAEFLITGMFTQPSLLSIVSGTTTDINAFYTLDNGQVLEAADPFGQPTWSSTNSAAVAVDVSGSITGSSNVQAQVSIIAESNIGLRAASTVILNKV